MKEDIGTDVRTIGPNNRSQLGINPDLPKLRRVFLEGIEDRAVEVGGEIDGPLRSVREEQANLESLENLHRLHSNHDAVLHQGRDRLQGLGLPRKLPVQRQFIAVLGGPLEDQRGSSLRKRSLQDGESIDRKGRFVFTVAGMQVRRCVIVVVHRDHDAEKPADLRHAPIVTRPVGDALEKKVGRRGLGPLTFCVSISRELPTTRNLTDYSPCSPCCTGSVVLSVRWPSDT